MFILPTCILPTIFQYCYVYIPTCYPFITALVNKGNCLFTSGQYEKASECYQEALRYCDCSIRVYHHYYYTYSIEATCSEALHNLALCHKRMNQLPEALDHFTKLHSIIRNSPHVIYQIADMYPPTIICIVYKSILNRFFWEEYMSIVLRFSSQTTRVKLEAAVYVQISFFDRAL